MPVVKYANGCLIWRDDNTGLVHRTDGPAKMWPDGTEEWYINGSLHRIDGPAMINAVTGSIRWYINGRWIKSTSEYRFLTNTDDIDMLALILKHGDIK